MKYGVGGRMGKIKLSYKLTNEHVLQRIRKKRTLLNNTLRRKAYWIGHILTRNSLLHDAYEGQMTKMKRVGRRITQLLNNFTNRKRYRELKIKIDDDISLI